MPLPLENWSWRSNCNILICNCGSNLFDTFRQVDFTKIKCYTYSLSLKLLLSRFSHVPLSATPETAAHQAPPFLGFSRQEHWSGLPFPSPMHESESEVAQSCPTLSDPMDCSLPVSSVHGIFQARVLEWGAIAFSEFKAHSLKDKVCMSSPPTTSLPSLTCQFLWNYVSARSDVAVQLECAEVIDKDTQISTNSWDSSFEDLKKPKHSLMTKYHAYRTSRERT